MKILNFNFFYDIESGSANYDTSGEKRAERQNKFFCETIQKKFIALHLDEFSHYWRFLNFFSIIQDLFTVEIDRQK